MISAVDGIVVLVANRRAEEHCSTRHYGHGVVYTGAGRYNRFIRARACLPSSAGSGAAAADGRYRRSRARKFDTRVWRGDKKKVLW